MPRTERAQQGDTIDAICHRRFGRTAGVTERVLAMNPGIAELGALLPQGTRVRLPDDAPEPTQRTPRVQLWT